MQPHHGFANKCRFLDLHLVSCQPSEYHVEHTVKATRMAVQGTKDKTKKETSITQGYGNLAGVQVSAQLGVQIRVKVNITMKAKLESSVQKDILEIARKYNQEENYKMAMEKSKNESDLSFRWLFWLLRLSDQKGHEKVQEQTHYDITEDSSEFQQKVAEKLTENTESSVSVDGHIKVIGQSDETTRGKVYLQLLKVRRSDGNQTTIVSSEGAALLDAETKQQVGKVAKLPLVQL